MDIFKKGKPGPKPKTNKTSVLDSFITGTTSDTASFKFLSIHQPHP